MTRYTVQPGDYPAKIAKKFGMSLAAFAQANPHIYVNGKWQVIFPGQLVNVAGQVTGPSGPPASPAGTTFGNATPAPASWPVPPPWMQIAIMEMGVHEWNPGDNPRILEYLASVGVTGPDETSWCAAFLNWCLRKAGFNGANSGMASDWFTWGRAVAPTYGAIVLFQPLSAGASGHVGLLHALDQKNVWCLSGNSSNQVRIAPYPKARLIHSAPYRWPY